LQEIGGFSTESVTEDAATSLSLHQKGLNSVYVSRPLISGLQPPTYGDFVRQRVRWAQGMTQIFFMRNPLVQSGLRPWQRLAYLSSAYFWFFGFARIVFILAPVAFLVFGLKIYAANLTEVMFYTLPHIFASLMITNLFFGKVRWPFISELYEYMLSLFTTRGVGKAMRNLKAPSFVVTPKTAQLDREFISELARPYYLLLLITILTLGVGVYRYLNFPADQDATIINMGWETFNLIILLGALGALLERRQRRGAPRVAVDLPATIISADISIPCRLSDVSVTGVRLGFNPEHLDALQGMKHWVMNFKNPATGTNSSVPVVPVSLPGKTKNGAMEVLVGVRFAAATQQEKQDVVTLVHGDSDRWANYLLQRDKGVSILRGLWTLLKIGTVHTLRHLHWVVIKGMQGFFVLTVNTVKQVMAWLNAVVSGASSRP
jgi:cellulose synthase (UDP-forming)